jgi:hypothetical protein
VRQEINKRVKEMKKNCIVSTLRKTQTRKKNKQKKVKILVEIFLPFAKTFHSRNKGADFFFQFQFPYVEKFSLKMKK